MYTLSYKNIPTWLIISSAVLAFIICVANLTVLVAFIIQHTIRKPKHYFLASLAVADFMVGFISMPFFLQYIYLDRWVLEHWVCDAWLILDYTACLASKMGVFLLTTDRFLMFTFPWTYRYYQTKRNVSIVIAIVWASAVIIYITSIAGWHSLTDDGRTLPEGSCHALFMYDKVFTLMWVIGCYWIPLVYVCDLYRRIYITALLMNKSSGSRHTSSLMVNSQDKGSSRDQTLSQNLRMPKCNRVTPRRQIVTPSGPSKKDNSRTDLSCQGVSCLVSDTVVKDVCHTGMTNLEINSGSTLCNGENKITNQSSMTKKPANSLPLPNGKVETVHKETDTNGKVTKAYDDLVTNEKSKIEESVMNGKVAGEEMINWNAVITRKKVIRNWKAKTKPSKRRVKNKAVTIGKAALTREKKPVTDEMARKPLQEVVTNENTKPSHDKTNETDITVPPAVGDDTTLKDQCGCEAADGVEDASRSHANSGVKRKYSLQSVTWMIDWNSHQKQIYKRRVRKSLKTITLILGAFIISWTPYNVVVFTAIVGWYENVNTTVYTVTYWLCYFNSAVNPLCYALANPEIKRTFIRIFKLDWHIV